MLPCSLSCARFKSVLHKKINIHSEHINSPMYHPTMMQAPTQPNTSPMKPPAEVPNRSNLITLLEAASSLDFVEVQDEDTDETGQTQQTQTAGEPTSDSSPSVAVSHNLLGKKKRPKKVSTFPAGKEKVATARPAAKLTLTQLLVASKNGGTPAPAALAKKTQKTNNNKKKMAKPTKPTFPQELMRMVTDEANASIVAFLPCGKQFIILDQDAFLNNVLPKSLLAMQTPHSNGVKGKVKLPSFTRRLNRWGFLQCRVQGLENHLVFAHPKFLRYKPELCKEIKSGFVSTAAKLKALPRAAPAYACARAAAAAVAAAQGQGNQPNENNGVKTSVMNAPSSLGSAPRATVPILPGNVYHRPVLKVKEDVVRSAGTFLTLPLFRAQAHATSCVAPTPSVMSKSATSDNNNMEREIILQTRYARLLRLQSNLQRKAVHATFRVGDDLPVAPGQTAGNAFLPHNAVMAATRTVTAGAMDTIRRDKSLFGQEGQDASATAKPSEARATSKLAHLREREMALKRALAIALNSNQLEYNNRAA